ncbi:hypothetical protein [Nonomuraea cavernae]|uniref:Uncharacterized protein n=1 Tax=Nonomuraea cavernae TaxID=2045107 RepID=A0A917YPX7_9ACTN|nr:hypothetical protein [Nonomuraea cavernae]MCA2183742.1 hypothetical protein [Nonomuraea cavernae]GGO61228.1 hypothetical protein GCM10012289_02960 [Nonomuraea cavernae]
MSADSDKLKLTRKSLTDASARISLAAEDVQSGVRDRQGYVTLQEEKSASHEQFDAQSLARVVNGLIPVMESALRGLAEQAERASDGLTLMAVNLDRVEDAAIADVFRDLAKTLDRPEGDSHRD